MKPLSYSFFRWIEVKYNDSAQTLKHLLENKQTEHDFTFF